MRLSWPAAPARPTLAHWRQAALVAGRRLAARLAASTGAWVTALALAHGLVYILLVPPWQGPDETTHYEYLAGLAAAGEPFPATVLRTPEVRRAVVQSAREHNWWFYLRLADPDGLPLWEVDRVYAGRAGSLYYLGAWPVYAVVQGWSLPVQLYALRLYSLLCQGATVALTYLLARELFRSPASTAERMLPAAAALAVAVFPMYTFVSVTFNDDNLVPVWTTASLVALVRGLREQGRLRWWAAGLALALLAALTKRTGLPAVALAGVSVLFYAWPWSQSASERWRLIAGFIWGLSAGGVVLLGGLVLFPPTLPAGLVYWLRLDPAALVRLAGYVQDPGLLGQLDWAGQGRLLVESFWGSFGWLRATLPDGLVRFLGPFSGLLLTGWLIGWIRTWEAANPARPEARPLARLGLLLLATGAGLCGLMLTLQFVVNPAGYGLTGRYLFPYIGAMAVLTVWGWLGWWPRRWHPQAVWVAVGLVLALDAAAVGLTLLPFFYS